LPYKLENGSYKKIEMVESDDTDDKEIFIQKRTEQDIRMEFLGGVDYAIITSDVFEKYKDICRSAPKTFLYNINNVLSEEDLIDMTTNQRKNKIFIYPESIEYFFMFVYKFIYYPITIYTFKCKYTENCMYKKYDTNDIIDGCVSV
jgi:hypothetical protein